MNDQIPFIIPIKEGEPALKIAFISLGCSKNLINTEQMMALCKAAGYEVIGEIEGVPTEEDG